MSSLLKELRPTLALAFPIIIGQVSQMLMGITDSVMIGRVGKVPLAASAFAHSLWVLVFIIGIGLLMSVSVLVARAHGAGRTRECGEYLRHGMVIALVVGVLGALAMGALSPWLDRFGQPAEVVAEVNPYFLIMAVSLVPTMVFQVLRQFSESVGHPWAPMGILLGGVGLNVFLNWLLIYGHWGCPALGLEGAGWATLTSRTIAAAAVWWWLGRKPDVRCEWPAFVPPSGGTPARQASRAGTALNIWFGRLSVARFREMAGIGVPAAGQLLFEAGAFVSAALMMGWLGTVPLAAHQIAISCASFTFMFPLGIGLAASIRVGRAVGEGRREALRAIGFGSLTAGVTVMTAFALLFALAGRLIAAGFTPEVEVVALAARLLVVAAIFQLFDGGQVIGAGALRGLADVKVPTVLTFIAYWMIALPGGYWLAFRSPLGPVGVWAGLAGGLACAAVLLAWRFHRLTASVRL